MKKTLAFVLLVLCYPIQAKITTKHLASDKTIIAQTLYLEARGEKEIGIRAVASVIVNRSKNKNFREVCLKPFQFSAWNNKTFIKVPNDKQYKLCLNFASQILSGKFKPSHNFRFYYNPHLCSPNWARKVSNSLVIGNHRFVQLIK